MLGSIFQFSVVNCCTVLCIVCVDHSPPPQGSPRQVKKIPQFLKYCSAAQFSMKQNPDVQCSVLYCTKVLYSLVNIALSDKCDEQVSNVN